MSKPIDLAKRQRGAKLALLLSLVALGGILTAAIAYDRVPGWTLIPVFTLAFLLGGNLAGRIFGLFFGAATKVVERRTAIAGTAGSFQQLGATGVAAGTAMRDSLAASKPTESEDR